MLRLGLQLTLRSGREALVRLLITAAAVAVGVALLLGVLAEFHAFQANANQAVLVLHAGRRRPCRTLPAHGELWNNSVDFYQGQTISRLDVAALGPNAPVPPGITRLPAPGEYYASPALAALLATVPADQLGERFPGTLIGTIGQAALNGPATWPSTSGTRRRRSARSPAPVGHLDQHRARAGGVHPVLPVRVRDRRARGAVPHAGADQHRHPARRRPARGAVRRAPAGRRDTGRHQGRSPRSRPWSARSSARCSAPSSSCWSGPPSPAPR